MVKRMLLAALLTFPLSACKSTQTNEETFVRRSHERYARPLRIRERPAPRPTPRPAPRPRRYVDRGEPDWQPNRRISRRWKTIVVHHSATHKGGAKAFDKFHRKKGWDELGYHFVIGNGTDTPDGFVEVGSRWKKQKHGAHCKTPDNYYNDHGIGICLVGDFTRTRPTRRQIASLERLTRFLTRQCRIGASQVTTHRDVTHKTACPGNRFSVASLRRALASPVAAASFP